MVVNNIRIFLRFDVLCYLLHANFCLVYSSTLNIKTCSSETSVISQKTGLVIAIVRYQNMEFSEIVFNIEVITV
jgi:hypothetical protein